jgi:RHH-type transcriptional regulator, rel operon repressor / antitoxin RelB
MSVTITLSPEVEDRVERLAAETGRDKNEFLRELVERGIDDMEDYHLAAAAMERVRAGKEKVYSSAEVRKMLGLED